MRPAGTPCLPAGSSRIPHPPDRQPRDGRASASRMSPGAGERRISVTGWGGLSDRCNEAAPHGIGPRIRGFRPKPELHRHPCEGRHCGTLQTFATPAPTTEVTASTKSYLGEKLCHTRLKMRYSIISRTETISRHEFPPLPFVAKLNFFDLFRTYRSGKKVGRKASRS